MLKKLVYTLLLLFVLFDLGYSFMQHYHQPLDGDMAWNIVPADDVKPTLTSPFGFKAIIEDTAYINPNRFFCHWGFREYMLYAPLTLQSVTNPINSVYLSAAIIKTLVQFGLLLSISIVILGRFKFWKFDSILIMAIITPLFQTNGYRTYMAIIDPSTTYAFFYALPLLLLIIYLIPFILKSLHQHTWKFSWVRYGIWLLLSIVICLSGPLNPGIILVGSVITFSFLLFKEFKHLTGSTLLEKFKLSVNSIPRYYWYYWLPLILLSFYSLYLGRYNSITIETQIPLLEMYAKLPAGLYYLFTQKIGFPLLWLVVIVNTLVIRKNHTSEAGKKVVCTFVWVLFFTILYILLLPLGGYREYRPNILRYDTILPITLILIYYFGLSSFYLLKNSSLSFKRIYATILLGIASIYTFADKPGWQNSACERDALEKIVHSSEYTIPLDNECSVVEWVPIHDPSHTELHGKLLYKWGITHSLKRYYNKP